MVKDPTDNMKIVMNDAQEVVIIFVACGINGEELTSEPCHKRCGSG